jgi:hypothetical protein
MGNIGLSNDTRLLKSLKDRKEIIRIKYLVLIPRYNCSMIFQIKLKMVVMNLAINSSFMPKYF